MQRQLSNFGRTFFSPLLSPILGFVAQSGIESGAKKAIKNLIRTISDREELHTAIHNKNKQITNLSKMVMFLTLLHFIFSIYRYSTTEETQDKTDKKAVEAKKTQREEFAKEKNEKRKKSEAERDAKRKELQAQKKRRNEHDEKLQPVSVKLINTRLTQTQATEEYKTPPRKAQKTKRKKQEKKHDPKSNSFSATLRDSEAAYGGRGSVARFSAIQNSKPANKPTSNNTRGLN